LFFSALMAFSPGLVASPGRRGLPRVFVAHGTSDPILPIDQTSRVIVPSLRQQGYTVKYEEFDGVHAIYGTVVTDALAWLNTPA
jgi:phospholipase/carboxylesterase